jgi:hypothetical protein
LLERQDDVIIQQWYKTNYFEKTENNDMDVEDAMKDAFQINENEIKKFEPKKKKKTKKKTGKLDQFMDKKDNDTDENSTD